MTKEAFICRISGQPCEAFNYCYPKLQRFADEISVVKIIEGNDDAQVEYISGINADFCLNIEIYKARKEYLNTTSPEKSDSAYRRFTRLIQIAQIFGGVGFIEVER